MSCRSFLFVMEILEKDIKTDSGDHVYSYEYIEALRVSDRKKANPLKIIAQRGCQEKFLASSSDITIFGGSRGGSKSFSLLMESLKDIYNPYYNSILLRNEKDDLLDLINTSYILYGQMGQYNKSISDMTWYFKNGGKLKFSYLADSYDDFKKRFQGKQYSFIGIDEITHCSYEKFKYLITCNRNAYGIRNRFYGTCNPDPDSWVRKFIDWWIGEDGLPIDDRDGIMRYCFMEGDSPDSIYWGDTPEEVYNQCKHIIDPLWKDAYEELGFNKVTMYVKSVTFIQGRLEENIKLIASDPNYAANLSQQNEEQRARDLEGNWNFKATGDDLIKMSDMDLFYSAPAQIEKGIRYVSADIAFEGGDFCVMWLWIDLHIKDVFVMRENSASTETLFKAKLDEWGVREENVIYDYWGVGQAISGHVKRAVKFTGTQKPERQFEKSYKNVKSQCAEMLAHYIQDGKISIEPRLLDLKFSGKKGKYQKVPLKDILMKERKCIRHKDNSNIGGFELINKEGMIKAVGYSPDFFESLIYRMYFEINKKKIFKPKGMLRYVSYKPL
uniref:terminase large subunit domain-containing protein n=2 Tax=Parabacteroides distasonis TaxID=823 RepID=UPI003FEEC0F6